MKMDFEFVLEKLLQACFSILNGLAGHIPLTFS